MIIIHHTHKAKWNIIRYSEHYRYRLLTESRLGLKVTKSEMNGASAPIKKRQIKFNDETKSQKR